MIEDNNRDSVYYRQLLRKIEELLDRKVLRFIV